MKNNKDILNEAFFKKSFSNKLKKNMPEYKPVDSKSDNTGLGSVIGPGYAVTDTDEVKRRLTGAFGAAFGNNSVKTMASRAVKTFPIIVSDNVEPDTVMTLKRLMEEQYAEYISLLVSNQVIDLSAYSTDETGNIAIQALDTISGTDFSKRRLANKAYNGTISKDDMFANVPLYNLIRQESFVPAIGDTVIDSLLEDAIVLPEDYGIDLVEFMINNADDIAEVLTETPTETDPVKNPNETDPKKNNSHFDIENKMSKKNFADPSRVYNNKYVSITDLFSDGTFDEKTASRINNRAVNRDRVMDTLRGYQGTDEDGKEIYNRLTNTDILLDKKMLQSAMNRSVGEMLADPKNSFIRDRFEKATYLLETYVISGKEYISYVTYRLGIPMSKEVRVSMLTKFPVSGLNRGANPIRVGERDQRRIQNNRKSLDKIMPRMMNVKVRDVMQTIGVAAGVGGAGFALGAAVGDIALPASAGAGAGLAAFAVSPFIAWALIPAVVGAGAMMITKVISKARAKKEALGKIEGWERVEALINKMDENQDEVRRQEYIDNDREVISSGDKNGKTYRNGIAIDNIDPKAIGEKYANKSAFSVNKSEPEEVDLKKELEELKKRMVKYGLTEEEHAHVEYHDTFAPIITEEYTTYIEEAYNEVMEEIMSDKELRAEYLSEAIKTNVPMKVKYVEKKPGKDIMITPAYSARSALAYGSTEIDRRVAKERRYNQPLVMTIKFKERFDSGDYSDNELVAVIGILGQIIRVPSDEMKYILQKNAEGETLSGFLSGDIGNTISDLISGSKIGKDAKNLPQSAEIWKNLEKVAHLAVSNKLAGKKTNNIANAHLVFSQKEVDEVRGDIGVDYLKDKTLSANLMKRYSAFSVMIANDPAQRLYVFDDLDNISWNVVPYSALLSKDSGDQLTSALAKLSRDRI